MQNTQMSAWLWIRDEFSTRLVCEGSWDQCNWSANHLDHLTPLDLWITFTPDPNARRIEIAEPIT